MVFSRLERLSLVFLHYYSNYMERKGKNSQVSRTVRLVEKLNQLVDSTKLNCGECFDYINF